MANKLIIRKGKRARFVKTYYTPWGNPTGTVNEVVTILDNPRDIFGRYCAADWWRATVKVRNKEGLERIVDCDDLEVYNTMADLTHEDYAQLRREICHGSLYLSDYKNSFGVDREEVYACSESFGEETGWNDKLDTPENFADYCDGIEFTNAA